jgi:hypothetical protein
MLLRSRNIDCRADDSERCGLRVVRDGSDAGDACASRVLEPHHGRAIVAGIRGLVSFGAGRICNRGPSANPDDPTNEPGSVAGLVEK